jgi:hypothetical protein
MRGLTPVAASCLCICIGIVSSLSANLSLEFRALEASVDMDTATIARCYEEATDAQISPPGEGGDDERVSAWQEHAQAQSGSDLSDALVQMWGTRCITPYGWCWLGTPLPVNYPCCCFFPAGQICGFVAP